MPYEVKRGQIWQLGRHRLMCGDATNREDVDALLNGHKATLTLTDPPYGVSIVKPAGGVSAEWGVSGEERVYRRRNDRTNELSTGQIRGGCVASTKLTQQTKLPDRSSRSLPAPKIYEPVIGDDSTDAAKEHWEIAKDVSDNQVIFGGNYFADFLPVHKRWLVWDKQNGQNNNFADGELAWTSFDKPLRIYQWRWAGMIRKGPKNEELYERIHPTQKPVGLLRMIIEDHTKEGDSILDCFLGSGSTLIAAETCDRTCYGMELSEVYCEKILKRYEDYTGDKPVLLF